MKKILVVMALAMVLVWGVGVKGADAGLIQFFAYDTATAGINCTPDGKVKLDVFTNTGLFGLDLYYSVDGGAENPVNLTTTAAGEIGVINLTGASFPMLVELMLKDGTTTYYQGAMAFDNPTTACGFALSRGVSVVWTGIGTFSPFSMTVTTTCEGISAVPIPAAAWLLGSGLFGLIGIRRRMKK